MARDIEEFLRKAAERRRQQQQEQAGGKPQDAAQSSPVKPRPARKRPRPVEVVEAVEVDEVVEAERVEPRRLVQAEQNKLPGQWKESVEDHVRHHIDTSDVARHADNLGKKIHDVHDNTEARMKRKFDRDMTRLDDKPSFQDRPDEIISSADSSQLSMDLLRILQTPASVQQAILLAEILKRPEFEDDDDE